MCKICRLEADRIDQSEKEYWRAYRRNHPEIIRPIQRRSYQKHRIEQVEAKKRYARAHSKEKLASYVRRYHTDVEFRQRRLRSTKTLSFTMRMKVFEKLGKKCVVCGINDVRVLQVNHKNGGGSKELTHNVYRFYKSILSGTRTIDDLETRCANCNILYEYERGKRRLGVMTDL